MLYPSQGDELNKEQGTRNRGPAMVWAIAEHPTFYFPVPCSLFLVAFSVPPRPPLSPGRSMPCEKALVHAARSSQCDERWLGVCLDDFGRRFATQPASPVPRVLVLLI